MAISQFPSGVQVVSGTVTANIGTTNGLALDATLTGGTAKFQGNVASGTADSGNPVKVGGIYNATMPTFTDGQRGDAQLTTRGAIKTTLYAVDSNIAVTTRVDQNDGVATSASGNNLAVINRNTVFNGTTWDRMYGDATNGTWVNVKAGSVTANIGTTNGLALDSSVNGILLSQGSTTSGQKGALIQGAVTTANPIYTTGQTSPLSLDTAGALRVHIAASDVSSSGGTSATDEAAWTAGTTSFTPSGGVFNDSAAALTSGQMGTFRATNNRGLHVNLRNASGTEVGTSGNPLSVSSTPPSDVTATGSVSALNGAVSLTSLNGIGVVTGILTGTWTASFLFEGTTDGTNWTEIYPALAYPFSYNNGTISANGNFVVAAGGYSGIRVRCNGYTSGTATITLRGSTADPGIIQNQIKTVISSAAGSALLGQGTMSGSLPVTIASDQSNLPANIAQFGGTNVVTGTGASGSGIPRVTVSNDSNILATQSGTWTVQPGNTPNTTPWLVSLAPGTSGWTSVVKAATSTTVVTVSSAAGEFGGYFIYNPNSSVAYMQVFDTTGAVTLGTTTPIASFGIPATSGANLEITNGLQISNGIKIACTTTATGSGAPTTGLDCTIFYH